MRKFLILSLAATLMLAFMPAPAQSQLPDSQSTITVSGTITGPGGPVPNVWIALSSPQGWQTTTTNASGFYSLSIQTDGRLWFEVRPDLSTGLAQVNRWMEGVTANLTQDFTLVSGHLLDLRILAGGAPLTGEQWLDVQPLQDPLPQHWWFYLDWSGVAQRHRAVLPPDIYYVTVHSAPPGYYPTTRAFDLRTADQAADLSLDATWTHPIPYDPPDATKITVGPPDSLGEATVTGAPGAALPLARVFLVNLNSTHQADTISEADGSFSAQIYAPPGSALMIKHGPFSWRWNDLETGISEGVNPFPGTILNEAHTHSADPPDLPFAAAGAVEAFIDDPGVTRNYVGAAWAMEGTLGPVVVEGEWTRVFSGTYEGQSDPGLYLGGLNWTHPALGDLDGDGDLDLLVGERSGHLVFYRNQGSASTPDWQFETDEYAGVAAWEWAYPALADVTGDGALDLFVGAGNGSVSIYYNDGTPASAAWPATPDVALSAGFGAAPALANLDNDGDLDLLVGHEGGTLYYFKNTGTAASPAWSQQTDSYGGISEPGHGLQPSFVNLDGDGDLDLLIGRSGDLVWYRNDGPVNNPTWTRMSDGYMGFGGSSAVSPATGDWDGDGDRDLVTGEHWGVLRFFRNDGPPAWTERNFSFPFDLHGDSAPALADWNNDGKPEMLLGQAHGNVHAYYNAGTTASPDWQDDGVLLTLPWTNHPHPFPTLADIDGDGKVDLFIGEGDWTGPGGGGTIRYYHNDGTASSPAWNLVTASFLGLDVGGWSTPVFADINGDGDLDLFVGDEAGTLTYVQNTGTASAPSWAAPVADYAGLSLGGYSAPSFLDVDADGDLDLLIGLETGRLAYVRNTGTASSPAWELVTTAYPGIEVGERAVPATADLDGDGDLDLLVGEGDGGLDVYRYEGPGDVQTTPGAYAPGDQFRVEGTIRLHSPAIDASVDLGAIQVHGQFALKMLYDQDGRPLAGENYFQSTMLTPSGFPIQRVEQPVEWTGIPIWVGNLRHVGGQAIEGDLVVGGTLPESLAPGVYRPVLELGFSGVPTSTDWLAANVVYHTYGFNEAALPPISVGQTANLSSSAGSRLIWYLMMDDFAQGTRGTGTREDRDLFGLAPQIVTQGAPFTVPPVDLRTGQPIAYRLEPFLPMISYTDRRMPTPPLLPFDLPGGQLQVTIQEPDGTVRTLGSEPFAQSFNRTRTTRDGNDLNGGTVQLEDVYSLKAASDRFRVTFEQFGHHVVTMTGEVYDLWGNQYSGGGIYDLWVAYPLDIDPGVLPGTPLAVGDAFNPTMQFYPRVPAHVDLTLTLYPDSDPAQAIVQTLSGTANQFGAFAPTDHVSHFTQHGEYRVDLTAIYTNTAGEVYMGAMTWGGVVMTPANEAQLVAHGRRGLDSLEQIPNHWFVACRDLTIPPGAISHTLNPYYNGDVLWTRMSDGSCGGDSLVFGASVQDTVGVIEAAVQTRANRMPPPLYAPGDLNERFSKGEIPLFASTRSGRAVQTVLGKIGSTIPADVDQIAYSYRSSQRPGVRVREVVAEDGQSGGYWRLDTLYDDQLGVGVLGDQANDYKFQYVGVVYRDLDTGHNEYLGQGTSWIFIPDDDATGSRVMPPFAGPGNGGWTTEGGPLLTLKGEDVDMFILPTGVQPGAVLQVGDTFRFAGHLMPTLDSQVSATITSPGGTPHTVARQANTIGYFYDPDGDFVVNEPGLWSVDVRVWHDGQCSGGSTVPPYPSGDVLGSLKATGSEHGAWTGGRYWFYVAPQGSERLPVSSPRPGFLSFAEQVTPITIRGAVPPGLSGVTVDYTITMPGYTLQHGQATVSGNTYEFVFDPVALQDDFPNLDLIGRDGPWTGLADTFAIGLLLRGQSGGSTVYRANTITIQGEQVFVGGAFASRGVYLPLILKGTGS